jgi:hypothetical protein
MCSFVSRPFSNDPYLSSEEEDEEEENEEEEEEEEDSKSQSGMPSSLSSSASGSSGDLDESEGSGSDQDGSWPPSLSGAQIREQISLLITCTEPGRIACDVQSLVSIVHSFVHPSVRPYIQGFTVENVNFGINWLNM